MPPASERHVIQDVDHDLEELHRDVRNVCSSHGLAGPSATIRAAMLALVASAGTAHKAP